MFRQKTSDSRRQTWNLKNKANFAGGEKAISSLKIEYYVNYAGFGVKKNKANFSKTQDSRLKTTDIKQKLLAHGIAMG